MAAKLKVDQIESVDGSSNITFNQSVTMASGKTLPAASLTGALPAISGANLTGVSAGKILQVVEAQTSTTKTVGGNTYTTTNLSGSITPSATNSKILVMVNQTIQIRTDTTDTRDVTVKISRDGTTILTNIYAGRGDSGNRHYDAGYVGSKVDSPNTTSSVTYETYFKISGGSADAVAQYSGSESTIILMEIEG